MATTEMPKALEPLLRVLKLLEALQGLDANFPVSGIRAVLWLAMSEASGMPGPTIREFGERIATRSPYNVDEGAAKALDRHTAARLVRSLSTGDVNVGVKGGLGLLRTVDDPDDKRVKRVFLTEKGRRFVEQHFDFSPRRGQPATGLAIAKARKASRNGK